MDGAGRDADADAALRSEIEALAARWPRALLEGGRAERLSEGWVASGRAAHAAGRPAFAEHPFDAALVSAIFEARRARRLVRGLEAAEAALEAQRRGLGAQRVSALQASPRAPQRISRLLLISDDGSDRFYRSVDRLKKKHGAVLEVLRVTCDELQLGAAIFGPGKRVRAFLVEHKDAVVRVLESLDWIGAVEDEGRAGLVVSSADPVST